MISSGKEKNSEKNYSNLFLFEKNNVIGYFLIRFSN